MTYGRTWANTVGQGFEIFGWLLLVGVSSWRFILWRRRRRLAGAGGSGVIAVDEFTGQYLEGRGQHHDDGTRAPGLGRTGRQVDRPVTSSPQRRTRVPDTTMPTLSPLSPGMKLGARVGARRDDAAQAEATFDTGVPRGEALPAEWLSRESGWGDDLPSADPVEDLLRLEEDS